VKIVNLEARGDLISGKKHKQSVLGLKLNELKLCSGQQCGV